MPRRHLPDYLFVILAAALLLMTVLWQIPMMVWDHLNLVPILEAWREGTLSHSAIFRFDGGHIHTAAYAVLLVTANLSHGHPWVVDVVSWVLLLASAAIVRPFIYATVQTDTRGGTAMAAMLVFLALYPGHLANLQWGWQVAVFLCLLGVSVVIWSLTRPQLSWWHSVLALMGAALAYCSFATALAAFPVALLLIALRHDQSRRRRLLAAIPWLLAGLGILLIYRRFATPSMGRGAPAEFVYLLNFLGAGISRLATGIAPWIGLCGIALAVWASWRCRGDRTSLPWIGFAVFGFLAGALVALGRDSALGADQAFVSRYVSFSILFWLGLFGLLCNIHLSTPSRRMRVVMVVIAIFACANALQLMHRASRVSARTYAIAQAIRETWPKVNNQLLAEIYFDQPQTAYQRLQVLRAWGYAPFREALPAVIDNPSGARSGH